MSNEKLPLAVEAEVQQLLRKWQEEGKEEFLLTEDQKYWLYRAAHIFQAHEKTMTISASTKDKVFTEAMVRYITDTLFPERSS